MLHIEKTNIHIGLEKPLKLLHMSDTHLCLADERDCERKRELAAARKTAYKDNDDHIEKCLAEAIEYGHENCDLIVHTGDLIDFVSKANVEKAGNVLKDDRLFFIAGNHEYSQYVGEAWEDMAYRMNSYMQIRDTMGVDMLYSSREIGGIRIVGIDDGYYHVEDWQTELLQADVEKGKPVLLVMHDPLFEESLYREAMDTHKAAAAGLVGCDEAHLARYGEYRRLQQRPNAATKRFIDYVTGEKRIFAILAGHLHFTFESMLPCGKMQYVITGSYNGSVREITID